MNIGVHFFDMLMWLFGPVQHSEVSQNDARQMGGFLELENARVKWFLSVEASDLPAETVAKGGYAHRSITMDGTEIEFSGGFTDLHTRNYQAVLDGQGFGIAESRAAIELVHRIRNS
jgi:UDP-N-acetyl-2-amino-2-deoxyglucuronate dehydrogenase